MDEVGGYYKAKYQLDTVGVTLAVAELRRLQSEGVVNNVRFTVTGLPGAAAAYNGATDYNGYALMPCMRLCTCARGGVAILACHSSIGLCLPVTLERGSMGSGRQGGGVGGHPWSCTCALSRRSTVYT